MSHEKLQKADYLATEILISKTVIQFSSHQMRHKRQLTPLKYNAVCVLQKYSCELGSSVQAKGDIFWRKSTWRESSNLNF